MKKALFVRWCVSLSIVAFLTVCAVDAKNQVERPFKIRGVGTMVVSLVDGSYEASETGWSTHFGLFSNEYTGYFDLNAFEFVSGTGTATAANGDESHWIIGTEPLTVVFTGGTGRFEGESGGFTYSSTILDTSIDEVNLTATITYSYVGEGSITY